MSRTAKIWISIKDLADALGRDPKAAERIIDELEADMLRNPKPNRDSLRREMIYIVANLSRLESRLMTAEGPLGNHSAS